MSSVYIGESAVETETEADSNDITEYPRHDKPSTGMFRLYDAIFSMFTCLCMTCSVFALFSY